MFANQLLLACPGLMNLLAFLTFAALAEAHIAAFTKGMYCENSTGNGVPFNPLTNLTFDQWWMHAFDGCHEQPPSDGVFLELPAGGSFDVEMAENKVCTTLGPLSPDALGNFGNCQSYDISTYGNFANGSCITSPNLHARNKSDAAGSAFAISYTSNISLVTPENLVVFSVAPNTPFEKAATFSVPAALPACPPGGCICAWGWVPNGCGTLNFYMLPYRCTVTGVIATAPLAAPQPPVYCREQSAKCIAGAKQMVFVYQQSGNNIDVPPDAVQQLAPGYSLKNGFPSGAQDDIFVDSVTLPVKWATQDHNDTRAQVPLAEHVLDILIPFDPEDQLSPDEQTPYQAPTLTPPVAVEPGTPVYPVATPAPPPSKPDKIIVAHVIVGNTYPYTRDDWVRDIQLASSKGIDAFALNYGSDLWEGARVADAYQAALDSDTGFKLFLSPDFTSLPCDTAEHASELRDLLQVLAKHAAQLVFRGRPLLSTFGGEYCKFGTDSVNEGWMSVLRSDGYPFYFVPAWFLDNANLKDYPVLDGIFAWDGSWPRAEVKTNWEYDDQRSAAIGDGKIYMAAASPWFFAHYASKNWFYGGDDWLFNTRWEQLIAHRDRVDIVEIISWNDYGESHYVGPIEGAQPGSNAWVDGFDHSPWLDMAAPYISTFKTGAWRPLQRDELYMWSRPHPHLADAPGDGLGKPLGWNWTSDYLWATVYATAPASVSLTSGDTSSTFSVNAGITKLRVLSRPGPIVGTLSRLGITKIQVNPGSAFSYTAAPVVYNYNAFVVAGHGTAL